MVQEDQDKKLTSVSIPSALFQKIAENIENSSFNSVSDYIVHVLRKALSETTGQEGKESFSVEDEERIKERLRSLGYLD